MLRTYIFLRQEMSKAFPSASVTGAEGNAGGGIVWEIGPQYFGAMLDCMVLLEDVDVVLFLASFS